MSRDQAVTESWRRFAASYPKHRLQNGGLQAYDAALSKVSASDLQFAVRRFAADVRATRPKNGKAWRYCPGPAVWLREERWRQYLPGDLPQGLPQTREGETS